MRLRVLAEREAQPRERVAMQRGEHVGLILRGVDGEPQQAVVGAARVVAGRQRRGAEPVGEVEHRVQADVAVAAHARVRRQPVGVLAQPRIDDAVAKLVAQVEREMRQAEVVREAPRAAHRGGRAARALAVVVDVGPQLERHGHRVAVAEQRRDRAVDTAGHRDERALRVLRQRPGRAHRGAERAMQRVGGEVGGVQLARAEAAERARRSAASRFARHRAGRRPRRAPPPRCPRRSSTRSRRPRSRQPARIRPRRRSRTARDRRRPRHPPRHDTRRRPCDRGRAGVADGPRSARRASERV